jgi:hypothetical protein
MDLARHGAIERGRRGRTETFLKDLESWHAARLSNSASMSDTVNRPSRSKRRRSVGGSSA